MRHLPARPAALAAVAGVLLLALPLVRRLLEQDMVTHMLVQFPLLVLAGSLLARALPVSWRRHADGWNAHGLAGLLAAALVLALLMIPRVLDLAVVDPRVEMTKFLLLLACGAALQLSWQRAGLLVQGFFLGNVLPMMAVVGLLYQDWPVRLCNAYLLGDQASLGRALVILALAFGAAWTIALMHRMATPSVGHAFPEESLS